MTSPIVHAEDLLPHLDRVVLLDVRTGPDAAASFRAGHLPGARFVDLDAQLASHGDPARGGRHPLPTAAEFGATLGRLGVSPDDDVVVYDLASGSNAASRLWWMLRAVGHARVRVLDGNRADWERAGLGFVTTQQAFSPTPPYPVHDYALRIADVDEVDARRSDDAFVVLDARSAPRYRGENEPIDPVAGHVPGAKNLFHLSLVDGDGRMLPPDAITNAVRSVVGGRPVENLIVHCGSGVTACHLILAMDHAGLGIPALYVGSWSEWCRQDRPRAGAQDP